MDRRTLAGGLGGLALVVAAVVVLREADAPDTLKREIDENVEVVQLQEPTRPANPRAQALDADTLQVGWAGSASAYEVRWNGNEQLVPSPEVELAGLVPDQEVQVEIRAVNATGKRSEPLKISAVPKDLYNDRWDDQLVGQVDRFDGPEALDPRKWRVVAGPECLGLRPFGPAKRIDVDCSTAIFNSNMPLRFGVPAADGAVGRAVLSVGGSVESSHVRLTLLPEKWQFVPAVDDAAPNGAVSLDITSQGTRIIADPNLPRTAKEVPLGDPPVTGLIAGVRHRWELRVLPEAVIALRDGVVVASEPVKLTEPVMWPRIQLDGGGFLDAFGTGGVPERVVPTEVILLPDTGELPQLQDAVAVKIIANQTAQLEVDGRRVAATPLGNRVMIADIPTTSRKVTVGAPVQLVVIRKPESRPGALPRFYDRQGGIKAGLPRLHVMHEQGAKPPEQFPPTGRILVTAEINNVGHRGIEIHVDDRRIVALPTNEQGTGVPGRHEFWLDAKNFTPGGSARLKLSVLPADHGEPVTTETVFELRKTP